MAILLFLSCDDSILNIVERETNYKEKSKSVYFRISDTGQTNSNTSTFGEDSDYNISPPSFFDNGDGTVKDNVTGLLWTKCSMGAGYLLDSTGNCIGTHTKYTWSAARNACSELTLAGKTWHLPTISEIFSLVNFGNLEKTGMPAIDSVFPNTEFQDANTQDGILRVVSSAFTSERYWTNSKYPNDEKAWGIHFDDGYINMYDLTTEFYVKCVADREREE